MNATSIKHTTSGQFIVSTRTVKDSPDRRVHICVVQADSPGKIVAMTGFEGAPDEAESIANAALFAVSKDMLDALIAIQETINPAYDGEVDLIAMNAMISDIFAKLANEAGE